MFRYWLLPDSFKPWFCGYEIWLCHFVNFALWDVESVQSKVTASFYFIPLLKVLKVISASERAAARACTCACGRHTLMGLRLCKHSTADYCTGCCDVCWNARLWLIKSHHLTNTMRIFACIFTAGKHGEQSARCSLGWPVSSAHWWECVCYSCSLFIVVFSVTYNAPPGTDYQHCREFTLQRLTIWCLSNRKGNSVRWRYVCNDLYFHSNPAWLTKSSFTGEWPCGDNKRRKWGGFLYPIFCPGSFFFFKEAIGWPVWDLWPPFEGAGINDGTFCLWHNTSLKEEKEKIY